MDGLFNTASSSANPFVNLAEVSLSGLLEPGLSLAPVASDDALRCNAVELSSRGNSLYASEAIPDYSDDNLGSGWTTRSAPCDNCVVWGYQCQTTQEREPQGPCIPCVSFACECTFLNTANTLTDTGGNGLMESSRSNPGSLLQLPTADVSSNKSCDLFEPITASSTSTAPPKIGTRFSRDSTRILRQWLSSHSYHPYPSEEEKKVLQHQTGLSKLQITNWLINARRRGKVQSRHRSTSPYSGRNETSARPVDIPKRPGTPALRSSLQNQNLNPLERWVDSPPEHEAATVTAIARAVASSHVGSSAADDSYDTSFADDEPPRSLYYTSSASSAGTSSGGSFASAYSHASKDFASVPPRPAVRGRGRQRKRPKRTSLANPRKQYQCTFCTETFRTKHDWQRHEKSLHMPLERWACSPNGPCDINPETKERCCVFCGTAEPSQEHIDSHNPSACQEREFNREDHLKQHTRLVHNAALLYWPAKLWKTTVPDIRSRCGFCGVSLDTWAIRTDHLADHFKMRSDMADWKGDWGFEDAVLNMVENSIPPYLIEYERFSPFPYQASSASPVSPRNAYELLNLELNHFLRTFFDKAGNLPNNREIQLEACRIVFASEVSASESYLGLGCDSWLRDLITSTEDVTREARFGPIRSPAESMMSVLQIKGKCSLFESCPCEAQLDSFVEARRGSGLHALSNQQLQNEACKIVSRLGSAWGLSSGNLVDSWLVNLISLSTAWYFPYRSRRRLSQGGSVASSSTQQLLFGGNDIYLGAQQPLEISAFGNGSIDPEPTATFQGLGILPLESELWKNSTTVTDDTQPLETTNINSEQPIGLEFMPSNRDNHFSLSLDTLQTFESPSTARFEATNIQSKRPGSAGPDGRSIHFQFSPTKRNYTFFNDANFNRWLTQELRRWIAATMSPNNPNCHVPSDQEIQHQARFIVYEDGDPWNQTLADNLEWLRQVKRGFNMETQHSLMRELATT